MFMKRMEFRLQSAVVSYAAQGGKYPRLMKYTIGLWGPPVYCAGYIHRSIVEAFKRSK